MPNGGTNGRDVFTGTAGNDTLRGFGDADFFLHSAGNDHYDGGAGTGTATGRDYDTLSYVNSAHAVIIDARNSQQGSTRFTGSSERDSFTEIEAFVGSSHGDIIFAGATSDVDGWIGDDWIFSGSGANTLNGSFGTDTLSYAVSFGGVDVSLASGSASGGYAAGDVILGFENLHGSNHADILSGDGKANTLWGAAGDDLLAGGGGDDVLFGGFGNDVLLGGDGADTLYGGHGDDLLRGGGGADRFVFNDVSDSAGTYGDVIADFSRAQGDKIDLSAIDANPYLPGNQAFSGNFLYQLESPGESSAFGVGTIAVTWVYDDTFVYINTVDVVNGYDKPEMVFHLEGRHDLTAADFIL